MLTKLFNTKPFGLTTGAKNKLIIQQKKIPTTIKNPVLKELGFQLSQNECLFDIFSIARVHIYKGCNIDIEFYPTSHQKDLIPFLTSTICSILLMQRGYQLIYGSAFYVNEQAHIISGCRKSGKSALTAELISSHQASLISDDFCVISINEDGIPHLHRGFPLLYIWGDVVDQLQLNNSPNLSHAITKLPIFKLKHNNDFPKEVPLKNIFHLENNTSSEDIIESKVYGLDKFQVIRNLAYQITWQQILQKKNLHLQTTSAISQHSKLIQLSRPRDKWTLKELAQRTMAHCQ